MIFFAFLRDRRWLEQSLLVAGFFCLSAAGVDLVRFQAFQQAGVAATVGRPQVLGRLEVPRLAFSVTVLEGDSKEILALGAGHLSETAALGAKGTAAIAGHRDLAFRALGNIRAGDKIVIHAAKDVTYRVTRTSIVNPDDMSALASDGQARLTLITCYPFHYVGSAPQRFIVEALLDSK